MPIGYSCALIALACGCASAADWTPMDVKPGVWETTTSTQVDGFKIPQSVLDKMSPEQKAAVDSAMKAQSGMPLTRRICIKKEDLGKPIFSNTQSCKETLVNGTAMKREINVECNNASGTANGTVRIEASNSENVKVTTQIKTTGARTGGLTANSTATAKWIGAVCTGKEE